MTIIKNLQKATPFKNIVIWVLITFGYFTMILINEKFEFIELLGFQGVNNITWENTDANCEVEDINGVTNYSTKFGFKDCTITGTTSSDYFSNITINCLVDSKTIDQSIYPELFDRTYHKTIYKKPNGDTFYRYLDNSNVWVYTQII